MCQADDVTVELVSSFSKLLLIFGLLTTIVTSEFITLGEFEPWLPSRGIMSHVQSFLGASDGGGGEGVFWSAFLSTLAPQFEKFYLYCSDDFKCLETNENVFFITEVLLWLWLWK